MLERLQRIGKKILATGNGRCNFTNRNVDKSCYYGTCNKLYNICSSYNTEEFFKSLGVYGFADEEGRVYPLSNSASSVLDGLRLEISSYKNIDVICDFNVTSIKKEREFIISSDNDRIFSKAVIVAGGGMSQSGLGSDGSMIRILKSMNFKISPLSPALTSFKVNPETVRSLKGVRAAAKVSLYSENATLGTEYGEIQFADGTISGICVFNLSCLCNNQQNLSLGIDFLPEIKHNELYEILQNLKVIRSDAALEDFLSGLMHKRIGMFILKSCTNKSMTEKCSSLTEQELKKISTKIKNGVYNIQALSGFEKSQVTSGGVCISEIDEKLRSKKIKGMYLCGELLDITGKCGGYNLSFAFGSGILAGKTCAEDIT